MSYGSRLKATGEKKLVFCLFVSFVLSWFFFFFLVQFQVAENQTWFYYVPRISLSDKNINKTVKQM